MSKSQSRLPRPASSPDRISPLMYSGSSASLKRSRDANDDEGPGPSKVASIGSLPVSRASARAGPPPLTKPRPLGPATAPAQTKGRGTRAVSVPLRTSKPQPTGIVGGKRTTPDPTARGSTLGRSISKTAPLPPVTDSEDPRWAQFQHQIAAVSTSNQTNLAKLAAEMEEERAKVVRLQMSQATLEAELRTTKSLELESRRDMLVASDELEALKKKHFSEIAELELVLSRCQRDNRQLKEDVRCCEDDLKRERDTASLLRTTISQQSTTHITLETQLAASQANTRSLQDENESLRATILQLKLDAGLKDKKFADAERELREAEGLRRKMHNMIQELKGNIRVFCRVRPPLAEEKDIADGLAMISFPDKRDHREIVLSSSSESAMGAERKEVLPFSFDRVFEPQSTQADVFEEISQLAQSCTDGYNVCIFAYGQTGSGKSFTMEGGPTDGSAGMIPRAVQQIFDVTQELKVKGWEYKMEGQFLEIYNETINDLLGNGELDKKKHEIKHEKGGKTIVTDVVVVPLHSPTQVKSLLSLAQSRRSVASTLMNERSSRSHSESQNNLTHESCEGSLNLVDLAGSERLSSSGAANDKDRLKETQAINKSLSALGDVIGALGAPGEKPHIPYRNSKLTYLLQNSLSGNSKTLMVLNLSPLAAHLGESICSLRFATKYNDWNGTEAANEAIVVAYGNMKPKVITPVSL